MMGTDDHREAYEAVLAELSKLADAWRIHREVVNRAISLLNKEVIEFQRRLDDDDKLRVERQSQVDDQFNLVVKDLKLIKRWQWIRLAIEVLAIVIVAAYLVGRLL